MSDEPESVPMKPAFTEDDILGAWECFEGDGIHGWTYQVLVVQRKDDLLVLEFWMPRKGECETVLHLVETMAGTCMPVGDGLRLTLQGEEYQQLYRVYPGNDDTFFLWS